MRFLLDANIIMRALDASGDHLRQRLGECDADDVVTSAIAFAEVALGSASGKPPPIERLDAFVSEVTILPFDAAAARAYAELPFRRGSYDRLIAAHALSLGLVLVTDNVAHFADVPGLTVENWVLPA